MYSGSIQTKEFLALNSTDGQALDKVLLEEGVGKDDGTNGNDSHRHTEGFGGQLGDLGSQRTDLSSHFLQEADGVQGLVDGELQVEVLGLVDQQQAVEEIVPDTDCSEQGDGSQTGHCQRQNDLQQGSPFTGTVDTSGLDNGFGNVRLVEGQVSAAR